MRRALNFVETAAPTHIFPADAGSRGDEGEPELSPMLSEIAAHCDPSFCADSGGVKYRVSSPEMHMSNQAAKFVSAIFLSLLAGASSHYDIAQRGGRGERLSFRTDRRSAGRPALVLPYRSRHQTSLLVSPGGSRKATANCRPEFAAICKAAFAEGRSNDTAHDRRRSRRITPADACRTGEQYHRRTTGPGRDCECGRHGE